MVEERPTGHEHLPVQEQGRGLAFACCGMLPVLVQVLVPGSYSIAVAVVYGFDFRPQPPAARTLPVPSGVAVLSPWHSWLDTHTCQPVLALDSWPVAG